MATVRLTVGQAAEANPGDDFLVFLQGAPWGWWWGTQYHIQIDPGDASTVIGLYDPNGVGLARNHPGVPYVDRTPKTNGWHRVTVTGPTGPYAIIVCDSPWAQKAFGSVAANLKAFLANWLASHQPAPPPPAPPPPAPSS